MVLAKCIFYLLSFSCGGVSKPLFVFVNVAFDSFDWILAIRGGSDGISL